MNRTKILRIILSLGLLAVPLVASLNAVEAARLTEVRDVLEDSGIGAASQHEISFVSTSGIAQGGTITVTFDADGQAFGLGSIAHGDMTMAAGVCGSEVNVNLGAAPDGSTWGVAVDNSDDFITFTSATGAVTAGHCVVLTIGTGSTKITNPSTPGIYDVDVATSLDEGSTKVAILAHVVAEVTVDETLTFTVEGMLDSACQAETGDIETSATSIPFGAVNANTFVGGCQSLEISTNATNGYVVTVQQDGPLTSVTSDTIDAGDCDGTCSISAAAAWASATNNGFGYTVYDLVNSDGVGTTGYRVLGTIGEDVPANVMTSAGVVDGSSVEVFFRISVAGDQPAGTYANEIVYVATPTY